MMSVKHITIKKVQINLNINIFMWFVKDFFYFLVTRSKFIDDMCLIFFILLNIAYM